MRVRKLGHGPKATYIVEAESRDFTDKPITKEQALANERFHMVGFRTGQICSRTFGPYGRDDTAFAIAKRTSVHVWKTRPTEWLIRVQQGLYNHLEIDECNSGHSFHIQAQCPILQADCPKSYAEAKALYEAQEASERANTMYFCETCGATIMHGAKGECLGPNHPKGDTDNGTVTKT